MKMILMVLSLSLMFSQQLQVDGNLKVTGEIDAQGQAIKNVGVPQSATDAVNLATVEGLVGMKADRIYSFTNGVDPFSLTVPVDKVWYIVLTGSIKINDNGITLGNKTTTTYYFLFENDIIISQNDSSTDNNNTCHLTIYEYPIQSSGTDQGMDYIVP